MTARVFGETRDKQIPPLRFAQVGMTPSLGVTGVGIITVFKNQTAFKNNDGIQE